MRFEIRFHHLPAAVVSINWDNICGWNMLAIIATVILPIAIIVIINKELASWNSF